MNPEQLLHDLDNVEYRQGFVEGHAKDTIAFQIRQLRKAENWDQRKLAEVAYGSPNLQPMVSRYENPDYGKYSITTLLELAAAFDVALVVRFAPFSELAEWDIDSNERTLRPAKYSQDKGLALIAARYAPANSAATKLGSMKSMAAAAAAGSLPNSGLGGKMNQEPKEGAA
jgi:transcriptional regulator with XRE-family HTH domain